MGAAVDAQEEGAASFSGRARFASRKNNAVAMLPPEEARVRAIAEVVNGLIQGVQEGKDVNLNQLKSEVSLTVREAQSSKCMGYSGSAMLAQLKL